MRVREIRSKVQCCAVPQENPSSPIPRNNRMWQLQREKTLGYAREKCQRAARYDVDGTPYCSIHAGKIALHFMLKEVTTTEMQDFISGKLTNFVQNCYNSEVIRHEMYVLQR